MFPKYIIVILIAFFLSSCTMVEYMGGISVDTYNKGLTQIEELQHKDLKNQAKIAGQVKDINMDLASVAKKSGDIDLAMKRAERAGLSKQLVTEARDLAKTELTRAEDKGSFLGLLDGLVDSIVNSPILSSLLAAAVPGSAFVLNSLKNTKQQNKRLKVKGMKYARSKKEDDLDEDFV